MTSLPSLILCNAASLPGAHPGDQRTIVLNYLNTPASASNVRIGLPRFVQAINYLPDRTLDLLELAAYAYCADRMISRGSRDAVEYQAWARSLHFFVKVRDYDFWTRSDVCNALSRALEFMTGDRQYEFTFQPGHSTPRTSLFDDEQFLMNDSQDLTVILFSGGLDSLSGTLEILDNTTNQVCLVSHQPQPGTAKTQYALVNVLKRAYPNRVFHYKFQSNLKGMRAVEETQRTRAFLYSSIAYAIGQAFGQNSFTIFENGITGMNFPRRADLFGARASRTTHPQTVHHLVELFSYYWKAE